MTPQSRRRGRAVAEACEPRRLLAFDLSYAGNFGPGEFESLAKFAQGDINGDGLPDVVFTSTSTNRIGVGLADGRGGFPTPGFAALVATDQPAGIAVGDLNKDGKLDLAYVGESSGRLCVRIGNGDGTFGPELYRGDMAPQRPNFNPLAVRLAIADFDGDGNLDVVCGSVNAGLRFQFGDGAGGFDLRPSAIDDAGGVNDWSILDVDADGRADVVYASRTGRDVVVVRQIVKDGSPVVEGTDVAGGMDPNAYLTVARGPQGVVFCITESPAGQSAGRVVIGRNPGSAPTDVSVFVDRYYFLGTPAIADWDGDGVLDLALAVRTSLASANVTLRLYTGNRVGAAFNGVAAYTVGTGINVQGVYPLVGDGDGNIDLVVAQGGQSGPFQKWSVWLNNQNSSVVSTLVDEDNGNSKWREGAGASLREVVNYAASRGGNQTIQFAPFLGTDLTVNLNSALNIPAGASITLKADRGTLTLRGSGSDRVIATAPGSSLTLRNLTITNGVNTANRGGGLVAGANSTLVIDGSTFVGNLSNFEGGAVYGDVGSTVRVTNSTFTGNTGIGAIATVGGLTLQHVTIAGNAARSGINGFVGGVNGGASIVNSILANNGGPDLGGGSFSGTNNIITNAGSVTTLPGNTINADPLLGGLAYNGGLTQTIGLLEGSPALNAGATLADVTTDQRGVARPQSGAPDLGAYEARISIIPTFRTGTLNYVANDPQQDLFLATGPTPTNGFFYGPAITDNQFYPSGVPVGTTTVRYVLPKVATDDLAGWADVRINVRAPRIIASAIIRVTQENNPAAAGSTFNISVQPSTLRDQNNLQISPTSSASIRLSAPGIADQTYVFTAQQIANWQTYSIDFPVAFPTPGQFPVTAVATLDGYTFTGTTTANIVNFAPFNVQASAPSTVAQGTSFALSGSFEDYGPLDTFTVSVNWGDGSPATVLDIPAGQRRFSVDKAYGGGYVAANDYLIGITVTDNYGGVASIALPVRVTRPNQTLVTTVADEDDGTADPAFGAGTSLREALRYAQANPGPDTVTFATSLFGKTVNLTRGWDGPGDDTALRIVGDVTLDGSNAVAIAIASGSQRRHILSSGGTFRLQNTALTSGDLTGVGQRGGALAALGTTFVDNVRFVANVSAGGGAVLSTAALTISRSYFDRNSTSGGGYGGAIVADSGTLTIDASTFVRNDAGNGNGGAIANFGATTSITNSTFTRNTAVNGGAIIHYGSTLSLTHCTIVGNTAGFSGGGVERVGRVGNTLSLRNTLVALNVATNGFGPDLASYADVTDGAFTSLGNNLISDGSGSIGFANGAIGDLVGTGAAPIEPLVGPFGDNGGPTLTISLLPGSPAVNAGAVVAGITLDQRGTPRDARPDIGAFEFTGLQPQMVVTTTIDEDDRTADARFGTGTSLREAIAYAQQTTSTSGFDRNAWTLNDSAFNAGGLAMTPDTLTLTDGKLYQSNSAWLNRKVELTAFDVSFRYAQDAVADGANGFTLTLQNAGLDALGDPADGLGYAGIRHSVAIGFGIYGGYGSRGVGYGISTGGDEVQTFLPLGNGVSLTNGLPVDIAVSSRGGVVTLSIAQSGNTFTTTLDGLDLEGSLGGRTAYLGFTGATGGVGALQQVSNFALNGINATVTFAPDLAGRTISLTRADPGPGNFFDGSPDNTALVISSVVTVRGPAAGPGVTLAIAPGTQRRHFLVLPGASLTLDSLTVTGGNVPGQRGGAVMSGGTLVVRNSTFTNNTAGEGGALQTLYLPSSLSLSVVNSTFTGNTADYGGAISSAAVSTSIVNCTIVGNTTAAGGALTQYVNSAVLTNTILSGNANAGPSNFSPFPGTSGSIDSASSNNLIDVPLATLRLGTFADNGGPTRTFLPLPGSPAINGGVSVNGITADQRGVTRPQGSAPDIGAVERAATAAVVSSTSVDFLTRQALIVNFAADASVTFSRSDLTLLNQTTNQTLNAGTLSWNDTGTQATADLTNQLPDGNYRATIGGQSVDFYVLVGDFNRDRTANFDDLLVLALNYNQSGKDNPQGDANYDGTVNFADLLLLAANYNRSLPSAARLDTLVAPPAQETSPVDPPLDADDAPSTVLW